MSRYLITSFLAVLCLLPAFSDGQQINGFVYDAKFDTPLAGANVTFVNTHHGTFTDGSGKFEISGIDTGTYLLRVTMIGYLIYEKEIIVPVSESGIINIYLQPTNITLNNEIVITARKIESEEFNSPKAITVISNKTIEQEEPRTTPEALTGATGVFLQKTNHGGGSPIIRGMTGNQNLLMIDGIRLNNATYRYGPNQYLNTIDPLIINKMEIIRGSGSVLYGSDAIGGVVNILTRNPEFTNVGFRAGGGAFLKYMNNDMEKTGRAEINLSDKNFAFLGGVTYNDFGDIVAGGNIGKQSPTGYDELAGDAKLLFKIADNHKLTFAYQYDKQNNVPRYDKIIGKYQIYNFDPQIRQLAYARLSSYYKNKWINNLITTISFNRSGETRIKQKDGETTVKNENDVVNTWGGNIEINSLPASNWKFTSGLEFFSDKVYSETITKENGNKNVSRGLYPDGAESKSFAFYSYHTIDFKKFSTTIGGRFNTYKITAADKKFGNVDIGPTSVVGNFSLMYSLSPDFNLIGAVYSSFRSPNINDLSSFGTFNYGIEVPNPDLKSEKSLNFELGLKSRMEKFSGSVYLYRNRLYNMIDRVEASWNGYDSIDGEKVYRKENFAKAVIQGIEAEIQYDIVSCLLAYGNITFTYGQNETLEEPMRRIPPLNGKLGVYYKSNFGLWSRLEWLYAGKQNRLSEGDISDSRIPDGGTPGWNVLNLRIGYKLKWFKISAGLNNIFNKEYRMHGSGVDGYGRSLWISVRINL